VHLQQHGHRRTEDQAQGEAGADHRYRPSLGDGTVSIFRGDHDVKIVNPGSVDANFDYLNMDASGYKRQVEAAFKGFEYDIIGVSAGFDTYLEDWGGFSLKRITRRSEK
jgi:acetoin utilization deacetylase AcuC-like enzyme